MPNADACLLCDALPTFMPSPVYMSKCGLQAGTNQASTCGRHDNAVFQHWASYRAVQVTYLMLNIWPQMMRQAGRKSCEETLRLVADMGYTLHELALSPAVWEQGANKLKERVMAEARDHPTDIDGLCAWVLQHSSQQGLWVDVLAVHDPQLGGSSCSVDGFQAQ